MTKATVKAVYELKPKWGRNKSYYHKANIIELSNGVKLLQSYNTIVAGINTAGRFCKVWGGYSVTTMKHISDFKAQFGDGRGIGKKNWEEMPTDKAFSNRYDLWEYYYDAPYKVNWY